MSYLGRSGSAEGEGQTMLGGGGGGAEGALSFPLSSPVGLMLPEGGGALPARRVCRVLCHIRALGRKRGLCG